MRQRTTVTAEAEDLTVLRDEARRRGVSLGRLLGEIVAEKAADVRRRRPRPTVPMFDGPPRSIVDEMDSEPGIYFEPEAGP